MTAIMFPKSVAVRSKRIRASANGEACTLMVKCNGTREGVVWCHSNLQMHGKGMGQKAHDVFGCYGCGACHAWLDMRDSSEAHVDRMTAFHRAMARSLILLIDKGLVKVAA